MEDRIINISIPSKFFSFHFQLIRIKDEMVSTLKQAINNLEVDNN